MPKNIVICCDGTGNQFGANNSNVVKIYQILDRRPTTQVAFYDPGVGTMGAVEAILPWTKKATFICGLAFGFGLKRNVCEAYQYLMAHYHPDDRIFVFGFSRGAYTARVLAGLLHKCGLLEAGAENLVPYVYRMFKSSGNFEIAAAFKRSFGRTCKPHFVGVWDTVSTVGWVYNPITFPHTAHNEDIAHFRHAISMDERRTHFRTNLFFPTASQDCKQVWFAGVHSDVGGGYPEAESSLAKFPLQWLIDEACQQGLLIDAARYYAVVCGYGDGRFAAPDPSGILHRSLKGAWKVVEHLPRLVKVRHGPEWSTETKWRPWVGLNEPRHIAEGSTLHQSVLDRIKNLPIKYQPKNLPTSYQTEPYSTPAASPPEGNLILKALELGVRAKQLELGSRPRA